MRKLVIEWKHYAKQGKTCNRCLGTGNNLYQVARELGKDLLKKNIDLQLKETILSTDKIPESNIILIDGVPIEQILSDALKGESECCSCGDLCGIKTNCRTVNINGKVYEEIPVSMIKEAISKKLNS